MIDFRQLLTTRSPTLAQRLARRLLRSLSWVYRAGVGARNFAYQRQLKSVYRSRLPVVSVGNLSVGGTGKSPAVAWIARWLRSHGVRVAILSRGYGQLDSGQNDEALELELQLPDVPHLQHWDRAASARTAEEELEMQVLVLDDGFQHRRMARDLEIVLLDATDPPSARHLLPGGLLREPFSSLRRADLILLTRVDQADADELRHLGEAIARAAPAAQVLQARHRAQELLVHPDQRRPLTTLRKRPALAFCAIGNPTSFFSSLKALGVELLDQRTWPDHHAYSAADVADLAEWTTQYPEAELLLCTLKDWVKLQTSTVGELELAALTIELEIVSGQAAFEEALCELLHELPAS